MPTICVAEDNLTSRKILEGALLKWGYSVQLAVNGVEALDILSGPDAPKLAILDWIMPGMEGTEVCRRLRQASVSEPAYVILLTGKSDKSEIVEGLEAGADDFIVKPWDMNELRARLRVGERIVGLQRALASTNVELVRYASEMEDLAKEKAMQLTHAERMATLGILSAGIAHEINNPIGFISGNAQMLEEMWPNLQAMLDTKETESHAKFMELASEIPYISKSIMLGTAKIKKIVNALKGYSRKNRGENSLFNVNTSIEQALEICHNRLKYNVSVRKSLSPQLPLALGDAQQIEQVLVNLFVNTTDALEAHKGNGTLFIATRQHEDSILILVEDDGPGFPTHVQQNLFEPFFTTKGVGKGTGLGLSISKNIVDEHGGSIMAENRPEGGARFTITLPIPSVN